jgi:hypothetical protein
MLDDNDKKRIQEMLKAIVDKTARFSQRKVGDTPTDDNQLTPRGYVNLYGSIAGRPASMLAQVGQQYFSTTDGFPIFFTSNNTWVDGSGSIIASN